MRERRGVAARLPADLGERPPPANAGEGAILAGTGAAGVLAAMMLALHSALAWAARSAGVKTVNDDATYILLARSLREFAYHEIHRPGLPWHTQYPPGYPALLALWGSLFGERIDVLLLLGIGLSTASLGLVFLVLRRAWSPEVALLCVLPLAVNPYLIAQAGQLASEAPYLFFATAALALLSRKAPRRGVLLAATVAAILATAIRAAGVTLLLALLAFLLVQRRWRAAFAFSGAAALTAGGWLFWTWRAPEHYVGISYIADAGFDAGASGRAGPALLLARLATNLPVYFGAIMPQALPLPAVPATPVDNVLGALVLAIGLSAGMLALARRWPVAALYVAAYATLLLLWPWQLQRYVVPIIPLLVVCVVVGAGELAERARPRTGRVTMLALALLLTGVGAYRTGLLLQRGADCDRGRDVPPAGCLTIDQRSFFAALEYIGEATPPGAVFLAAKPAALFYYTGRRSVSFARAVHRPAADFIEGLRAEGAEFILAASVHYAEPTALAQRLQERCEELQLVGFFAPRTYLFRIAREAAEGERASEACVAAAEYRARNAARDFEADP